MCPWQPIRLHLTNRSILRFIGGVENLEFFSAVQVFLKTPQEKCRFDEKLQYGNCWKAGPLFVKTGLIPSKNQFSRLQPKINGEVVQWDTPVNDELVHAQFENGLSPLSDFGRNTFLLRASKAKQAIVRVWTDRFLVLVNT